MGGGANISVFICFICFCFFYCFITTRVVHVILLYVSDKLFMWSYYSFVLKFKNKQVICSLLCAKIVVRRIYFWLQIQTFLPAPLHYPKWTLPYHWFLPDYKWSFQFSVILSIVTTYLSSISQFYTPFQAVCRILNAFRYLCVFFQIYAAAMTVASTTTGSMVR